jgi:IclR family mhp operon transcriptional activator
MRRVEAVLFTSASPVSRKALICNKAHSDDVPFLDDSYLRPMLRGVQQWSRATRIGEEFQPKTASFAVPVWFADRVVACISAIWTRGAMRLDEALHNMEGPLRDISVKISTPLDA